MNVGSLTGSSSFVILFGWWSIVIRLISTFRSSRTIHTARLALIRRDTFVHQGVIDLIKDSLLLSCFSSFSFGIFNSFSDSSSFSDSNSFGSYFDLGNNIIGRGLIFNPGLSNFLYCSSVTCSYCNKGKRSLHLAFIQLLK